MNSTPSNPVAPSQPSSNYPSTEAMKAAVELEIHKCLGHVQTVVVGLLIQKVVDAESASLKARAEQAERAVDVLESNARRQAKLLADTGRKAEELEGALRKSNDALSDWLAFAEEELGEFDLEECEFGGASEALCHKCQSAGCINLKIRNSRAALSPKPAGETGR